MTEINPIEFAELYSAGEDPVSIADQLGISFEDLVKIRKRLGFPPWKMEKKLSKDNRVKIEVLLQKIWLFYKTSEKHHKWDIYIS